MRKGMSTNIGLIEKLQNKNRGVTSSIFILIVDYARINSHVLYLTSHISHLNTTLRQTYQHSLL
jgi:hypothetical protein